MILGPSQTLQPSWATAIVLFGVVCLFLYSGLMSIRLFLIQLPVSYVYCQREKQQQHLFRAYSKFQSIKEYYGELLLFMFVELYRFQQILIFCVKWGIKRFNDFAIRQKSLRHYTKGIGLALCRAFPYTPI